jgi:soluble lytic murein transglycosylase-like protein
MGFAQYLQIRTRMGNARSAKRRILGQKMKLKKRIRTVICASAIALSISTAVYAEEIPAEVRTIAEELGAQYGICPELIEAICYQESRFQPGAIGGGGQYIGVMQVNPVIHAKRMQRLGVTDLTDLRGGMTVGTDYLSELFEIYEDPVPALMAYGGWGRQIGWHERTGSMPGYVKNVLDRSERYERQHQK